MCISTAWSPQSFQLLWRGACSKIRELVSAYSLDCWRTDELCAVKLLCSKYLLDWSSSAELSSFMELYIYIYIYIYRERERERERESKNHSKLSSGSMLTGTFSTVQIAYLVIQIMIVTLLLLVIRPINRIFTLNVTNSSTNTARVMKLVAESLWTTRDIKLFRLQIH